MGETPFPTFEINREIAKPVNPGYPRTSRN
jgi:hypothetical protein